MFATVSRARQLRWNGHSQSEAQEEEKPEPGVDSTYGVRSFGDSDFGSVSELPPSGVDQEAREEDTEKVEEIVGQSEEWTPTSNIDRLPPNAAVDADADADVIGEETSPSSPIISSPHSPFLPEHHTHEYYRQAMTIGDDLSEPSSPASFASMPSYISSSLSRTSSLGPETRNRSPHPLPSRYYGTGTGMGGSEELVMPTLNVSQSQSQPQSQSQGIPAIRTLMSGRRVNGRGTKIVLVGSEREVQCFIGTLKDQKEVIELARGWGIVGGDKVVATITTGTADQIETRLENAYTTLGGALHPDPSPELSGHVHDLVAGYADKSDWVHLVIVLDIESRGLKSLSEFVPVISARDVLSIEADAECSLQSPPVIPDPTPRAGLGEEGLSYFASHEQSHDHHPYQGHLDLVSQLIEALHHPDKIQNDSISKFTAWRRSHRNLASSHDSLSHEHEHAHSHESSSTSFEAAPMPTLARAQGGGEWEANLSRRLAKRRQSQPHSQSNSHSEVSHSKRGKRKSTTSRPVKAKEKEACGPLFPFRSSSSSSDPIPGKAGIGIGELVEKTFGGLRRRWRWGLVAAAAVALVVGWNWSMRPTTCI